MEKYYLDYIESKRDFPIQGDVSHVSLDQTRTNQVLFAWPKFRILIHEHDAHPHRRIQ